MSAATGSPTWQSRHLPGGSTGGAHDTTMSAAASSFAASHTKQGLGGRSRLDEEPDDVYFNDAGVDEVDRDFKRSQENFPLKLYRIIYESVKSGRGDVISFFPHGRAFAVHKPKEFISEIMPKYFSAGRMNTFLKQLNLYSFRRITEGRDKGGYFHPQFIHGKRHLCKLIKRKKTDSKPKVNASTTAKPEKMTPTKTPPRKIDTDPDENKDESKAITASSNEKPVSTNAYAATLAEKMKRERKEKQQQEQQQFASRSSSQSPEANNSSSSSSRHPKMRWKHASNSAAPAAEDAKGE